MLTTGLEVGLKFFLTEAITVQILVRCTLGLLPPCGFHERQVVENKDRFLEGAEFTDEWESYMLDQGIEKQKENCTEKEQIISNLLEPFPGNKTLLPTQIHLQEIELFNGSKNMTRKNPSFLRLDSLGHPPYDPTPEFLGYMIM